MAADAADVSSLAEIRQQASVCQRCDLYRNATQVVAGEGDRHAALVFVGEQPGDQEDRDGRPFVGPAGRLLDKCLHEARVAREDCYVTNAVKHFKYEQRGKKRIHQRPNAGEVQACKWWLGAELRLIKPKLVVALGATAVQSLLGRRVGVTRQRGQILSGPSGLPVLVTIHPSYLLRIPDHDQAEQGRRAFIEDLRKAQRFLEGA